MILNQVSGFFSSKSILSVVNWAKSYKNRQIRLLFRNRIQRFISILGRYLNHYLNHQITLPGLVVLIWTMAESVQTDSQPSLSDFTDSTETDHEVSDEGSDTSDPNKRSDDSDHDSKSDDSENTPSKAIIYARVSSHEQTDNDDEDEDEENDSDDSDNEDEDEDEDNENDNSDDEEYSGSIEGQIDELKEIAEENDLELAHEPIVDEAQTGTNFDREGIRQVFKLAQRDEVEYLLVEKVDRIGRSAAETLYFIYLLQSDCGVTLITPTGERDVGEIEGLLHTTLMSLVAEIENEIRTSKATKERVRNFVDKRNWSAFTHVVPVGYSQTDDGWLEIDPDTGDIPSAIFEEFTDPDAEGYASYRGTERVIDDRYDDVLDGHRMKTILQNPVYIGKPQIPESWVIDLAYDNVVEDPDLQLVDEELFQEAQEIIEEKNDKHSSDEETRDLADFVEEFDLFPVIAASKPVRLLHDCGNPMIKAGQRTIGDDVDNHTYYCKKCEEYRKWPKEYEYERMRLIHNLLDEQVSFLEALKDALKIFRD